MVRFWQFRSVRRGARKERGPPRIPDEDPERFQVTELPPVRPETTEHRTHAVTCTCGHTTRAQIPDRVKASAFGPRLASIMAMFTGIYQMGRRQAVAALADLFGVKISLSALSRAEDRVSKAVEAAVDETWNKAQQADVKHTDGTSWRQAGQVLQLWTIATAAVTVFKVLTDGKDEALKALLGRIKGVLVSDRAAALNFWAMKRRQICWAHLLRKFVSFSERAGPAGHFGRVLLEYTGIMFDYYRQHKDGEIPRDVFRQRMAPIRLQVEAVPQRAVRAKIKRLSGSCDNILADLRARPLIKGLLDRSHREEHGHRSGACVRLALERLDRDEPVPAVEVHRARLGVNDDAHAPVLAGHPDRELEHEAEQLCAEALALHRLVDREAREPQHRQRVAGEPLACGGRDAVDLDVARRHGGVPEDAPALEGHIGDTHVVPELVLAGELVEETIEVRVARSELRAVVALVERPNLHRASGREGLRSAFPSPSPEGSPRRTCGSRPAADGR